MKRTTYIMIGMLVTGVAMVCGLMFYVVDRNVTQKDNFMEIGGERKTVQLPSCRVLKLTQPPVVWKQKKEGIVEAERMFSFGEVPLEVTAGDSLQQGSFSYAGDMEAFMSMTSVGDTLLVTFDFPEDKLEQHFCGKCLPDGAGSTLLSSAVLLRSGRRFFGWCRISLFLHTLASR